ncbi:adenine phosphoribosyltransferase 1-like isoform X3 [Mangifera indica]|uniref:adenine phosphoribosyltransferase 1-like isoform X3 n=1 Tax=Mangifera indica TaxID=29780 RepID=UPI001CFC4369|nr:adenine phosphoribosyltransferase 1-like isoform X3 [Mangifera indica]
MMQAISLLNILKPSSRFAASLQRRLCPSIAGATAPVSVHLLRNLSQSYRVSVPPPWCCGTVQHQEMASDDGQDPRISRISSVIRVIPDFPKPGIMFQDITTLLLDTKAFRDTIDLFVERYKDKNISVVAGEVISEEYALEYGTDVMEMHVGAVEAGERALVVDDLIATGGTLCAAIRLLERVGVHVVECACVIELPELQGRKRLGDKPLFVLVSST